MRSFFLYSDVSATQEVPIVQRFFGIVLPRQHQVHGRCHAFRWSLGALKEEFSLYQTLAWNIRWDYYHFTRLTTFDKIEGVLIYCLLKGNSYTTGVVFKWGEKSIELFSFEKTKFIFCQKMANCRSQWPRGLRRRSTAARLLISWVRIPPGACLSVCLLWVLCVVR